KTKMPTSYSKFTYADLVALGIKVQDKPIFLTPIPEVQPTEWLVTSLAKNRRRKLKTEKAKSEFAIAPVLDEIEERNVDIVACYSGYIFDVDKPKGLKGFCDFLMTFEPNSPYVDAPVFCIVEAKNDNLDNGTAQCIAEMYAAQLFNQRKGKDIPIIYGATTFGFQWKFHQLEGIVATSDVDIYYLNELPKLLGVLQHIVNQSILFYKK
ncbi:MAG: hypothetical protein RLZZ292_3249, partial [Bacteroidota bacterium]